MIQCHVLGDSALLVNFPQEISIPVHAKVTALTKAIENAAITGVLHSTPAYCSITVRYDPLRMNYAELQTTVLSLYQQLDIIPHRYFSKKINIPVCYSPPFNLDMKELEIVLGIAENEIISLHTGAFFHVYMLGFLPGFAYMGTLPKPLVCPRKAVPRLLVPARSVGLAGQQTGIYPLDAPGGWQIIGRTPLPVFDSEKENPFLFSVGDEVKFYAISPKEFETMESDIVNSNFNYHSLYAPH